MSIGIKNSNELPLTSDGYTGHGHLDNINERAETDFQRQWDKLTDPEALKKIDNSIYGMTISTATAGGLGVLSGMYTAYSHHRFGTLLSPSEIYKNIMNPSATKATAAANATSEAAASAAKAGSSTSITSKAFSKAMPALAVGGELAGIIMHLIEIGKEYEKLNQLMRDLTTASLGQRKNTALVVDSFVELIADISEESYNEMMSRNAEPFQRFDEADSSLSEQQRLRENKEFDPSENSFYWAFMFYDKNRWKNNPGEAAASLAIITTLAATTAFLAAIGGPAGIAAGIALSIGLLLWQMFSKTDIQKKLKEIARETINEHYAQQENLIASNLVVLKNIEFLFRDTSNDHTEVEDKDLLYTTDDSTPNNMHDAQKNFDDLKASTTVITEQFKSKQITLQEAQQQLIGEYLTFFKSLPKDFDFNKILEILPAIMKDMDRIKGNDYSTNNNFDFDTESFIAVLPDNFNEDIALLLNDRTHAMEIGIDNLQKNPIMKEFLKAQKIDPNLTFNEWLQLNQQSSTYTDLVEQELNNVTSALHEITTSKDLSNSDKETLMATIDENMTAINSRTCSRINTENSCATNAFSNKEILHSVARDSNEASLHQETDKIEAYVHQYTDRIEANVHKHCDEDTAAATQQTAKSFSNHEEIELSKINRSNNAEAKSTTQSSNDNMTIDNIEHKLKERLNDVADNNGIKSTLNIGGDNYYTEANTPGATTSSKN